MTDTRTRRFALGALVAIAAGLAAALLFVLHAKGSLAGVALLLFTPLPVMIASLSYGLAIGASASIIGALFLAGVFQPLIALGFIISMGAPAAVVATAAVLASPADDAHPRDRAPTVAVMAAVAASVCVAALVLAINVWRAGGFDPFVTSSAQELTPVVKEMLGETHADLGLDPQRLARLLILFAPVGLAGSELLLMTGNLWLAGRVAVISGNLPRPWPKLADDLWLPPLAALALALACGLAFLTGPAGVLAGAVAAALGGAFALQGLAVAHVLTRGVNLRPAFLFSLYALVLLLPVWPLLFLAIAGIADALFRLRAKKSASINRQNTKL
ncbi:MAG: DUF2232 domain-containing protein [Hyphomicrobiales bacterium]|nr:DUF2232 domain-containing protein [Hyphomicrobiales bacterium]